MTDTSSPSEGAVPAPVSDPGPTQHAWLLVMPLRVAGAQVLVVVGEADVSTAEQLRTQIVAALAERPALLRVELAGLDFCDLRGLDALHDAAQAAAAAGVPLQLRGMSAQLAWLHSAFPPARPSATCRSLHPELAERVADAWAPVRGADGVVREIGERTRRRRQGGRGGRRPSATPDPVHPADCRRCTPPPGVCCA